MKVPDIDIGACSLCMGCVEICPQVFRHNDAGYIEIVELPEYSEKDVDEAIMLCPEDCISWKDDLSSYETRRRLTEKLKIED